MSVYWTYMASFFMGAFGGFTSLLTGVLAFMGAITSPEDRATRFAVLLSMSSIAGKTNTNK